MIKQIRVFSTVVCLKRLPNIVLTGLFSATLLLSVSQQVFADDHSQVHWTPSEDRGQVGNTRSGGRRGQEIAACSTAADSTRLTLLVPDNPAGLLTTSSHPTFVWHAATQGKVNMQFVLMDPSQANPLYTETLDVNQKGLVSLTLPETVELETGIRYRWTVISSCADGMQQEIYARSFIERVDRESLEQSLIAQSPLDQAMIYAESGIWYDALAQLLLAEEQDPTNSEITQAVVSLLNQAMGEPAGTQLHALTP